LNNAIEGYWINWEWMVAWAVREINYQAIMGDPDIPKNKKPSTKKAYMKLNHIDKEFHEENKRLSDEEIKKAENKL